MTVAAKSSWKYTTWFSSSERSRTPASAKVIHYLQHWNRFSKSDILNTVCSRLPAVHSSRDISPLTDVSLRPRASADHWHRWTGLGEQTSASGVRIPPKAISLFLTPSSAVSLSFYVNSLFSHFLYFPQVYKRRTALSIYLLQNSHRLSDWSLLLGSQTFSRNSFSALQFFKHQTEESVD